MVQHPFAKCFRFCFLVGGLLLVVGRADAANFAITIKNTTSNTWSTGLITLQPMISLGLTPQPGGATTDQYYTYVYSTSACDVSDSYCSTTGCDDGDATILYERWGLTLGTNAWIVPAIAVGATTTVSISVSNGSPAPRIYYITAVYGFGIESEDDIVMMHQVGQPSTFGVPVFDSMGLPVSSVAFELSGYDVNSVSSSNGNGPSCTANKCPVSPPNGCWVALGNGTTGATFTAQPAQPSFGLSWIYSAGGSYTTDGIALGNLSGATGSANELVGVCEAGTYSGTFNPLAKGRAVVLSALTGAAPSATFFDAVSAGHDFMGLPTVEELDGTAPMEFVASEFVPLSPSPGATAWAADATAANTTSAYWGASNLGYPGFWNMGASTGDVRSDNAGIEVIVPTWAGDLVVLNHTPGASLNTYTLPSSDNFYGHVAVGNARGDGKNAIVGFGGATGKVYVWEPIAGNMNLVWSSTPVMGTYAFGSGPALGNIDGDAALEIVVATAGTNMVYAYDATNMASGSGCKYQWAVPGAMDFAWSSPVIGDVDGATGGVKEVVVFSSNSVLGVLSTIGATGSGCKTGTIKWTYTVGNGGPAWFTPALGNMVTGVATPLTALDVVVANYNTFEVVDVASRRIAFRYSDPTAQFYPSAVIEPLKSGASNPGAALYVPGWANGKIYRFTTPLNAPIPAGWPTFMGANTRTGAR